jgi:hypothetical protein
MDSLKCKDLEEAFESRGSTSKPVVDYPEARAEASRLPNGFRQDGDRRSAEPIGDLSPRGETSERQRMVYFLQYKLLYGSDPFQRLDDGTYTFRQTVWELMHAVELEKLSVNTFFMMHIGPTPWSVLNKVVENAENMKSGH